MASCIPQFRSTEGRVRSGVARESVVWLAFVPGIFGAALGQSGPADDSKSPRRVGGAARGALNVWPNSVPGPRCQFSKLTELTHHASPLIQRLAAEARDQIDRK